MCAVLAVLAAVGLAAGGSRADRLLRETAGSLAREGEGGAVAFTGTVAECGAADTGIRLSVDHLTIQRKDNSEQTLFPKLNVMITTEYEELLPGDRIAVSGEVVFWDPASNPGQFDLQSYYACRNTLCVLSRAQIRVVERGAMSPARALCLARRRLGAIFERILEERQAKTMEAICLGERALLSQEWKQLYQEGGIAHILAISGLHISLIGMCLYRLLRRLGAPFALCCAVSGGAVALYVGMTGAAVPAVRALIMFAFWLGAQLSGRKYDMTTAAAAAAVLLLFADARNLTQSSFLLSFGAVLTIALLVPCVQKSVRKAAELRARGVFLSGGAKGRSVSVLLSGAKGRSVSVLFSGGALWLGTLPITLYFFYQAAPWSILLNLAVVPLMPLLMLCGFSAAAAGLVSLPLGTFLAAPAHYLLALFEFLCHLKEGLPLPLWVAGRPAWWRIALYYGLLLAAGLAARRRTEKRGGRAWARQKELPQSVDSRRTAKRGGHAGMCSICLLWLVCGILCVRLMSAPIPGELTVTCLDVGQGDAALIRLPGGVSCLVDGGSSSESKLWQYRIGRTVKYYGVRTLDYIFLSHADEDHISGIEEYLQEYEPGFAGENIHGVTLKNLVLPPAAGAEDFARLRALAREKGIRVLQMEAGGNIAGKSSGETWSITCLAPDAAALTGDRNEDSMVLLLQYGAFRMLFTGDLEGEAERRLAESGTELSADVLKVGHHGSGNASSERFLEQVQPRLAVISCGEDNPYGHPAPGTVARLQNVGCRILQTSLGGAVTIESDGDTYRVETYRN